jgi:tetratricopeptide (TPR) repeat protein
MSGGPQDPTAGGPTAGGPTATGPTAGGPTEASSTFTLPQRFGTPGEAAPSLVLPPGTAIGRYLVLDHLGAGGMGTVHAAWDRELQRKIALKLVRPERKAGEGAGQARARFLREAQAVAQISHPNVVAVFDLGPWGDEVYLAMEFVEGRELAAFLEELPPGSDARRWPRVLEVFGQIGRGLQAVHAAGLVHRDVKPANLMIGKDGRARVMDFGLARRIAEAGERATPDSPAPATSPLEQSFTHTGHRIGTPSYMAPEQFLGLPCDQRADVFSFSVALFEALYGLRPFGQGSGLSERLLAGTVEARPAGSPVPEALHRVVLRGLAREPEDRWPAIGELLAAAEAVPQERRRRRQLAMAAGGLALLGLLAYGLQNLRDARCADAGAPLAAVFGEEQKAAIASAFRQAGEKFGPAGEKLVQQLEDWSGRWTAQRRDACEATHRRGEQSEELLDRRMFCLDRRLAELRSTVSLLVAADLQVAENPQAAIDLLGDLESCADPVQLASGGPLPTAENREEVRRIQQQLSDTRARAARAPGDDSRSLAEKSAEEAARLGYMPLLADARLVLCMMDTETGNFDAAFANCTASAAAAAAVDDAHGLAKATGQLAWLYSSVAGKYKEAQGFLAIADAAAGRLERRALLAAGLAQIRSQVAGRLGDQPAALEAARKALALASSAPNTAQLQSALYSDLGNVLTDMGRWDEAKAALDRSLELQKEAYGPDHPNIGITLYNQGSMHWSRNQYEDALKFHHAALEIFRKAYGSDNKKVALTMNGISMSLRDLGRDEEADRYLLEAIAILERVQGPEHIDVANSVSNLAYKYRRTGELDKALELYRRSHRIYEKNFGADSDNFDLANSHQSLGLTLSKMERHQEALAHLERAYSTYRRKDAEPRLRGGSAFVLGRALWNAGGERIRSRRLVVESVEHFSTDPVVMSWELDQAKAWLAEHP